MPFSDVFTFDSFQDEVLEGINFEFRDRLNSMHRPRYDYAELSIDVLNIMINHGLDLVAIWESEPEIYIDDYAFRDYFIGGEDIGRALVASLVYNVPSSFFIQDETIGIHEGDAHIVLPEALDDAYIIGTHPLTISARDETKISIRMDKANLELGDVFYIGSMDYYGDVILHEAIYCYEVFDQILPNDVKNDIILLAASI